MNRRSFLASAAAAGLGASLVTPRAWALLQARGGCEYLADLVKNWDIVRPMLASRYHRLDHSLYHFTRNTWSNLSSIQKDGITRLGWGVPRPSLLRAKWDTRPDSGNLYWAAENGSGEDFLYFHRWMIAMVDMALKARGKGPVVAWSDLDSIPAPKGGCPDEQVPDFVPRFEDPKNPDKPIEPASLQIRVREIKSDGFFWDKMNWWGHEFRDRGNLKTMTLGELGARLEMGVHNQMHIRWSAYPSNGGRLVRDESDIREKWDDPGYDTLFDEYSSHVSPIFFRLHKWIDNRIEDWAEAHAGHVTRYRTPHGFDWFRGPGWVNVPNPWSGAWGFGPMSPDEEKRRIRIMESVYKWLYDPAAAQQEEYAGKPAPRRRLQAAPAAEERPVRIVGLRDIIM